MRNIFAEECRNFIKNWKTSAESTTDEWLKLNIASCVIRQTRSWGVLVLRSNWKKSAEIKKKITRRTLTNHRKLIWARNPWNWGATPGIVFLCVFVDYLNKKIHWVLSFFLTRSPRILFFVYIYILAVGNTPYGKRHTSRIICVTPLQSILAKSFHSRQSFWNYWQMNSTHSSTRKTPQRRTLKVTLL